ncbi:MAG: DUF411 domain-containing protein [Nanoarchaeota archaeon]
MECPECKTKNQKGCCKDMEKHNMENKTPNVDNTKGKSKGIWVLFIGIVAVLALVLLFTKSSSAVSFENIDAVEGDIKIYKSMSCGCCEVYLKYANSKINHKIDVFDMQNPEQIKKQYGIPSELESCHTTIIGDYFIEGHIPLEAVEKLLAEQPDIAGIAMPGMPSGSPGMPGQKYGDFVIYAVANDGSYSEFMRI